MKPILLTLLLAATFLLGGCYLNMSVTRTPPYNVVCPGSGASVTNYRASQGSPCDGGGCGSADYAPGYSDCARPGYCSPL